MSPALPNFFIIGAAKAGTTSLYQYLSQHPDVYMPRNKEPHWFARVSTAPHVNANAVASEQEYLRLFRGWKGEKAVGEASPSYLWDEKAPRRIRDALPEARIIAILRNPVERAYSHYLMNVRAGIQSRPFEKVALEGYYSESKSWGITPLYVDLGFYAEQVKRYFEIFDRDRIQVFLYEDLARNPVNLIESALEFIEVDPGYASSIRTDVWYNRHSMPKNRIARSVLGSPLFRSERSRSLKAKLVPNHETRARLRQTLLFREEPKPDPDPAFKDFLTELYRPDVLELQSLLDRDLSHWM